MFQLQSEAKDEKNEFRLKQCQCDYLKLAYLLGDQTDMARDAYAVDVSQLKYEKKED